MPPAPALALAEDWELVPSAFAWVLITLEVPVALAEAVALELPNCSGFFVVNGLDVVVMEVDVEVAEVVVVKVVVVVGVGEEVVVVEVVEVEVVLVVV
jgi:hypothetical protein